MNFDWLLAERLKLLQFVALGQMGMNRPLTEPLRKSPWLNGHQPAIDSNLFEWAWALIQTCRFFHVFVMKSNRVGSTSLPHPQCLWVGLASHPFSFGVRCFSFGYFLFYFSLFFTDFEGLGIKRPKWSRDVWHAHNHFFIRSNYF